MSDSPRCCQRKDLHARQGLNAAQRAQAWAREPRPGSSWRAQEPCRPRQPRPRPSHLAPCQQEIGRMRTREPAAAAQGCQRLRAPGFADGSSLGNTSGRPVSPQRHPACLKLAFAPGACAQDAGGACGVGPGGPPRRRLRCFVLGLCDSRRLSVAGTVSQPMAHFLACHPPACAYCGVMPPTGRVDQRTSAVLQRAWGAAPVLHPRSADFAAPHGCRIVPCPVGTGHAKGRVENGGGDVKKHGLAALARPDCRALQPAARPGLETVAQVRRPGATRPKPTALWPQDTSALPPLPLHPCAIAPVSQGRASRPLRLTLDTNRSALPAHLAGPALTLQTSPDRRWLSLGKHRIARQVRRDDRDGACEAPEHPHPLLAQRHKARAHPLVRRFRTRAPRAATSSLTRAQRRLTPHHPVRTLVALRDLYGHEAGARAMEDAFASE